MSLMPVPPALIAIAPIIGTYCFIGCIYMLITQNLWLTSEQNDLLSLVDQFNDDRECALWFGITWPLIFLYYLKHRNWLEATRAHALRMTE
jgi:hypothetical protein